MTETADLTRPSAQVKRTLRGSGMLTPTQPLVIESGGRREKLAPGTSRLHPSHPAVREHPDWFEPADARDAPTRERHRELLRSRGSASAGRAPRRPKRPYARGVLPPASPHRPVLPPRAATSDWRLPA